jgi:carbon-monoxide dehydrogenase medium subunit
MIPAAFDYQRAGSLDEALDALAEHGSDAKVLAGGQSLIPLMKLRLARPERVIDIGRIAALGEIASEPDGGVTIGALATYAAVLADGRLAGHGALADALPRIGDVQVRNRGTIGGAIAHADPAADLPAVLLALEATVVARSARRGERTIPIAELFVGPFQTALAEDELLTAIRLPAAGANTASAYQALEQRASGYPLAGVAVLVRGTSERWTTVRIGVTGVGDCAYRASRAEALLEGNTGDDAGIAAAVATVTDGITVARDIHAEADFRAAMAGVMAKRALELARARLG